MRLSPGGPARDENRLKHAGGARSWRKTVQAGFLALTLWIGYRFVLFVGFLEKGEGLPPTRPPGVEAFLPISSLASLKYWIATGVFNRIHPAGLIIFIAACTGACPARIDVQRAKTVRSDECHACFRCVDACPVPGTLSVSAPGKRFSLSPAAYAVLIASLFLAGSFFGRAAGLWHNAIPPSELKKDLLEVESAPYGHGRAAPGERSGERPEIFGTSH